MNEISIKEYLAGIREGNKRILAKAITLIESKKPEHRALAEVLLKEVMPYTGNSVRVGVTGVPGVGKSTFIESFGLVAIKEGKKVAGLAIDPSSTLNKGSILGDKTRMEELSRSADAFIRPSPSSGFLGGVANTTFETMLLCEAAGYDYILIEKVGVGQSEVMVSELTDVFLFLKITGGGDELQGIKRGIMEMVDLIFSNKVENENLAIAKQTKQELLRALYFMPEKEPNWKVPVLLGSALERQGLDKVYNSIERFIEHKKESNRFFQSRREQAEKRFFYWVKHYLLERTEADAYLAENYELHKQNASELKNTPSSEAKSFVDLLFKSTS